MLVLPKRRPHKQAKDLLYVHDTFAIFADSLPAVRAAWDALQKVMLSGHVRTFEKAARARILGVDDHIRGAARMAADRAAPPSPELLLLGLRRGFSESFGVELGTPRK